ncbi:MAG: Rab family GTPase [Thermonemataceae bacterium]
MIGNFGVGKTSLTERFVHKRFSDEYLTTLGVRIDKKEVVVAHTKINLVIWDIAGEVTQKKVNKSYYLGASGVIYVFDLTRPVTYASITAEISFVKETLPLAKVVLE